MNNLYCIILLICLLSCKNDRKKAHFSESEILQRALYSYNNEDYEKSLNGFDSLIAINPLKGEYYFKRGYSKSMLLDDEGAMNDYLLSIKYVFDKKKPAFLNIGTLYRGRGQYDSAIHFYDKAIETDSTYQKAKEEKEEVLKLMIRNKKLLLNN